MGRSSGRCLVTDGIRRREFLARTSAGLTLAGVALSGAIKPSIANEPLPSVLKGVRQLFLDDALLERLQGVRRVLHSPTKYAQNPILSHKQSPWQRFRCQLYGTALYDPSDQRVKLWYLAVPRFPFEAPVRVNGRLRAPNFQFVAYAESADGIAFEMPNLGLVDFEGSTANNLCRIAEECVEGIAVVLDDRTTDTQARFKALYWEHYVPPTQDSSRPARANGMGVSFSSDGKTWTDSPANPILAFDSDTGQQAVYDAQRKEFIAYGRFGMQGRCLARSQSTDFNTWSQPERVFETDANDGNNAQIYGMGVSIYEGLYVGLPWIFHEGTSHRIDVQLTVSRDGRSWNRVANREVFLANGPPGSWDAGIIFTASQPIVVMGDELLIYYSACEHDHDFTNRPKAQSPEYGLYWDSLRTSIGVAKLRRDGFVSLEPNQAHGRVVTKSFSMPATSRMYVNVDAAGGALQVRLHRSDPETVDTRSVESAPISTDRTQQAVEWLNSNDLPPAGATVFLEFLLTDCALYAYWFD